MTDDEAKAIGLRAVAAGFRVEPGCRVWRHGILYTVAWRDGGTLGLNEGGCHIAEVDACEVWPDFREWPSMGCLIGQVRKAFAATWRALDGVDASLPQLQPKWNGVRRAGWDVVADGGFFGGVLGSGATEVEALVAALAGFG